MRYLLPPTSKITLLPAQYQPVKCLLQSLKLLQLAFDAVVYHSIIAASAVSLGAPFGKLLQKFTSADLAITFTRTPI
ncbi:hypothetical protein T190_30265 [Sinorhizobium meliloti CCBAU 01290]|nr:hypothetical protein T190_30265 [Sinorhizobium meliloti CCBAU 01290]